MATVKLVHFVCDGADNDSPQEGFEVIESDSPLFSKGDFLLCLDNLHDFNIEICKEDN